MISLDEAQKRGIVIGLGGESGQSVNRMDVDKLLLNYPKTFNLFLLALVDLQDEAKSNNDKMGYFQIAGIHGLPLKDWDGVAGDLDDGLKGSYCPHGTILFPTWHRPYLAMLEVEAVKQFRLPYWDYFRPRGGNTRFPGVKDEKTGTTGYGWDFSIPYVLELDKIMVQKPFDKSEPERKETDLVEIDNPLYQFKFPKKNGISADDWKRLRDFAAPQTFTARHYRDWNKKSNFTGVNTVLAQRRESNVEAMLNLFYMPAYKDYVIFSNKAVDPITKKSTVRGSVEGLHDDYHGNCGGDAGHMSRVPVAAFDPVFWLHHCNIDRIVAIWQFINSKSWFPEVDIPETPKEDTPLLPFRSTDEKTFWSSKGARKTDNFGYSFSEIQEAKSGKELLATITRLYSWSSQAYNRKNPRPICPPEMVPLDLSKCQTFKFKEGTLETRLSKEIEAWSAEDVTEIVPSHTTEILHKLAPVSTISESQVAVDVSALKLPVMKEEPEVIIKKPDLQDKDPSKGPPNDTDEELLSQKPKGTDVLRQWYVDSFVEKAAFDGSFTIYYFVGNFPADQKYYETAPTIAGTNYVFTAPSSACDNCGIQEAQGLQVTDTTPITPILLDYVANGELRSLHPEHVTPFLRTNLHWRAVGVGEHEAKPSAEVAQLEISVSSTVAYLYADDPVPEFIGGQTYPEVTAGRAGGVE